MRTELLTELADEELWRLSLEGDREAFGRIVARYQALICSLAYSRCGSLQESEDLAQEVFVSAWKRLKELREPGKLRHWLCGIARNRIADVVRREVRRGGRAARLEVVEAPASTASDPAEAAVTREEETLLWRALGGMPEIYREPLVLFYREQQSVAEVAAKLELTEEAVKQRLSRGRAMLREEMATVVESTLSRTKPGSAFTVAVLVALPMSASATTSAALLGAATKSVAGEAGKGIIAKIGAGAVIGPVIGLIFAYLGTKAAASTARSEPERDCILRYARWRIIPFCFLMSIGLVGVLSQAGKLYTASAVGIVGGVIAWTAALVGGILWFCRRMDREVQRIRQETRTTDVDYEKLLAARGKTLRLPRYVESKTRLLGLPLFAMAWGGADSDRYRAKAVLGWIAIGDVAVSPFLAFGGVAVAPIAMGAICVGVLSLSVFWGVAFGVLAAGSLAFGWWSVGCAAVGWKCAVGFAAVAREYALGFAASANATGAAAKDWLRSEWFSDFGAVIIQQAHWWLLLCLQIAVVLGRWVKNRSVDGR